MSEWPVSLAGAMIAPGLIVTSLIVSVAIVCPASSFGMDTAAVDRLVATHTAPGASLLRAPLDGIDLAGGGFA